MSSSRQHRRYYPYWVYPSEYERHNRIERRGRGHNNNYYYIAGSGSGVFNTAVFMVQTRNLANMPGMLPVVITKDKRHIRVGPYTTMNRL